MTKQIAKQSEAVIYVQPDGAFTPAVPFERGQAGTGDITLPFRGDKTVIFGTDAFGNPVPIGSENSAPSASPNLTIENFIGFGRDFFERMSETGANNAVQVRFHDCVSLDNPSGWTRVVHLGKATAGDKTITAPVNSTFSDTQVAKSTTINAVYFVELIKPSLARQTTSETQSLTGVAFLNDRAENCGNGYPGPDKIGYITTEAAAAATANVLYTVDAGSTWSATSAPPFAADEYNDFPVAKFMNKNQYRLIVGRTVTDAAAPAEIAYADITLGAEGSTSWTSVDVGSTNGDVIEYIFWPEFGRLYVATAGDIYLSTDQGETFTLLYTGSLAISQMAQSYNGDVYAVGAGGTLLVEKSASGTFTPLTSPAAVDTPSIAIGNGGELWIGSNNGIYYSENSEPQNTGAWTLSKSFGTGFDVVSISVKGGERALGGDSQLVYAVVNDSNTPSGGLWVTIDGGGFWEQIANVSNSGYTAAYHSIVDQNIGWIVGGTDASTGLIHKYSPAVGL